MQHNDFKPGDVVQLNSGGPYMTVEQVGNWTNSADEVHCVYFVDETLHRSDFFPSMLKGWNPKASVPARPKSK